MGDDAPVETLKRLGAFGGDPRALNALKHGLASNRVLAEHKAKADMEALARFMEFCNLELAEEQMSGIRMAVRSYLDALNADARG